MDVDQFHHPAEGVVERTQRIDDLGVELVVNDDVGPIRVGCVDEAVEGGVGIAQQLGAAAPGAVDLSVAQNGQQPRPRVAAGAWSPAQRRRLGPGRSPVQQGARAAFGDAVQRSGAAPKAELNRSHQITTLA